MRKIDESQITSGSSMYFKKGTWTHLQAAYTEGLTEIVKSLIGSGYSASSVYVLNGCVNSGSGSSYVISAGSVFYNGEIYLVDAVSFTASGGQTAVGTIVKTQYSVNADPVTFTDGSPKNVHDIYKLVFASGVSSSGLVDFSGLTTYSYADNYQNISNSITLGAGFSGIQKLVFKYYDGTIQVICELGYSTNIAVGAVVISGLPNNGTNFKDIRGYSTDGTTDTNVDMKMVSSPGIVRLRSALTGGGSKSLIVEFSYKLL